MFFYDRDYNVKFEIAIQKYACVLYAKYLPSIPKILYVN